MAGPAVGATAWTLACPTTAASCVPGEGAAGPVADDWLRPGVGTVIGLAVDLDTVIGRAADGSCAAGLTAAGVDAAGLTMVGVTIAGFAAWVAG